MIFSNTNERKKCLQVYFATSITCKKGFLIIYSQLHLLRYIFEALLIAELHDSPEFRICFAFVRIQARAWPPPRPLLPPPILRFLSPVDLFFDLPRLLLGIFLKTTNSTRKEKTENAIVLSVSNSPTRCSFLGCQQQLTTTQEVFALVNVNPIIGRGHMSLLCLEFNIPQS